MKKSKHSDNEKVRVIKSLEDGVSADILCRECGISRSTLYQWQSSQARGVGAAVEFAVLACIVHF